MPSVVSWEPAEVVDETDDILALFPKEPATRGHTMVITKRHHDSFLEVPPDEVPSPWSTVTTVGNCLRGVLNPEGMNVISSAGAAASQSVMHVHVHLVPRWADDAVGKIWPPKERTSPEVRDGLADAIREFCGT